MLSCIRPSMCRCREQLLLPGQAVRNFCASCSTGPGNPGKWPVKHQPGNEVSSQLLLLRVDVIMCHIKRDSNVTNHYKTKWDWLLYTENTLNSEWGQREQKHFSLQKTCFNLWDSNTQITWMLKEWKISEKRRSQFICFLSWVVTSIIRARWWNVLDDKLCSAIQILCIQHSW